jgi:hypothetical protein
MLLILLIGDRLEKFKVQVGCGQEGLVWVTWVFWLDKGDR